VTIESLDLQIFPSAWRNITTAVEIPRTPWHPISRSSVPRYCIWKFVQMSRDDWTGFQRITWIGRRSGEQSMARWGKIKAGITWNRADKPVPNPVVEQEIVADAWRRRRFARLDSPGRSVSSQACRGRNIGECEAGSTENATNSTKFSFHDSCISEL